MAEDLSKL
jgi:hypothetical protein